MNLVIEQSHRSTANAPAYRILAVAIGRDAASLACIELNEIIHYSTIDCSLLSPYEVLRNARRAYLAAVRNLQPELVVIEQPDPQKPNCALREVVAGELFSLSVCEKYVAKLIRCLEDITLGDSNSAAESWNQIITKYPDSDRLLSQLSLLDSDMRLPISRAVAIALIGLHEPQSCSR